jgi:hypothetical protein
MAVASEARPFDPKWPEIESLPKGQVRFTYDGRLDTLFVNFYGKARPAASEPLDVGERDYLFVRVDPLSQEVVGLQIEDFLSYAVGLYPGWVEAIEIADLRGYDDIAAANLRRWARAKSQGQTDAYALISDIERMGA